MPTVLRRHIKIPPTSSALRSRRVHDDGHSDQAEERSGDVPAVGAEAVGDHAPGEGAGDEDAAVGGEDAAEVRIGLQGGDEAVEAEGDDAGADPTQPLCSRTPCQTSQAPPISAIAARMKSRWTAASWRAA